MSSHSNQPALPNALRASTGGTPVGANGFSALQKLKVRTVISVDGARPGVDQARSYEMRYVHMPIGYEGIDSDRCCQLARAVTRLPGPICIHFHHGQHRGPAAAAVALIGAGKLNAAQGRELLIAAGTGTEYTGLWNAVATAQPLNDDAASTGHMELPEVVEPQAVTNAMAELQITLERLESMIGRHRDATRPQLAGEAVLLREQFTELLRLPEVRAESTELRSMMKASQKQSTLLVKLLRAEGHAQSHTAETAPELLNAIRRGCRKCHARYRDHLPTIRR